MLMHQYRFNRYVTIACIIYALIQNGCYADDTNNDAGRNGERQKPNIIVILADDMVDFH